MKPNVSFRFLLIAAALLTVPGAPVRPPAPSLLANDTVRYTFPAVLSSIAVWFRV